MGKFDPHIPRTRGRLPWRYEMDEKFTNRRGDRWILVTFAVGALFWLCLWLVLR